MKNLSLIISIVALAAASVFGVLSLTDGGKKADAATEGAASEVAASKGDIVYSIVMWHLITCRSR